jgi:DNA-binding response OmpR family regulator
MIGLLDRASAVQVGIRFSAPASRRDVEDARAMTSRRLMVVEDDDDLRSLLRRGLGEEGFEVTALADGSSALAHGGSEPDAIIIDIGLPDADGRDVCLALRARGWDAPVLFLTARDAVTDRLAGFSAGGDDYVTKPFHFDEVVARLRALLRRTGAPAPADHGGLRLDPVAHAVSNGEREATLTPTEFRLLAALAAQPAAVVRRRDLVRAAWPEGAIVYDNTLDQYVARLRRKLREIAAEVAIVTVRGVGYRLQ